MDVFLASDWSRRDTVNCDDHAAPTGSFLPSNDNRDRYVGYGHNWGFSVMLGGGLLQPRVNLAGGVSVQSGVSMTSIEYASTHAAFDKTYSRRRYTFAADGTVSRWFSGPRRNSALQTSGRFHFTFVDTSAKSVQIPGFTIDPTAPVPGTSSMIGPHRPALVKAMYCKQEAATVSPPQIDLPLPDTTCGQFIDQVLNGAFSPDIRPPN